LNPYNIRLVTNLTLKGYRGRWIDPDGQESKLFDINLPLGQEDKDDLRWYLEEYLEFPGRGDHARAKNIEAKFDDWGKALYKVLFDSREGEKVYSKLMKENGKGRQCLLTFAAEESSFLTQPWEMMLDENGPLAFHGVTIRRQLRGLKTTKKLQFGLPLKVLLIVSRPKKTGFIDPRNSVKPVLDALDALSNEQIKVEFCEPPTLPQLELIISDAKNKNEPYHIVHFDGHGTYLPHTGVGGLYFENEDETYDLIPGKQLGDLLSRMDIPIVILEACRGSDLSAKNIYGSVAPALLECGVGSVIAFSHSVHVKTAKIFVERFYQEMVQGKTVGQAVEECRSAIHADKSRWLHYGPGAATINLQDWFIPQLYQVGADPALILDEEKPSSQPKTASHTPASRETENKKKLHGFPPPPIYKFQGRALEMLELERAFRRHNAVLVSGMGGMGKTALAREAAAWWLRTSRFDTAVFCSFEQKAGAERVVQLLGQALEGEDFSNRKAEDQWDAAVELFHSRRVLLVWDNFESTLPTFQKEDEESALSFGDEARRELTQLFRELTKGKPAGRILVTCRPVETGLPAIKETELKGLYRPDSLYLLTSIMDIKNIPTDKPGNERSEINLLLDKLSDHPLSIELIAPHLKTLTPEKIRTEFSQHVKKFKNLSAEEVRNISLLASMEISKKRLSDEAQNILPYLAWFEGGVFEVTFLEFSGIDPQKWSSIRDELEATALIKIEDLDWLKTPYLSFHPTLPFAANAKEVKDFKTVEKKFIEVYYDFCSAAKKALFGNMPAAGMGMMAQEEANVRNAITRAFHLGDRQSGWSMADTLQSYLQSAGRLRERDKLVKYVKEQMPEGEELDSAICESIQQHAWSLFTQGQAQEAIQTLQNLLSRLESEGLADDKDPTVQIALSNNYLGRIYYNAGHPNQSLKPLQKSLELFEQLGEDQRDNLSAALGSLSNAYRNLGNYQKALENAEKALNIVQKSGNQRNIAAGYTQIAKIFKEQQRFSEADEQYKKALQAAQTAGDIDLQGSILQHQGGLQRELNNDDRAVELYRQAITLFQQSGEKKGEMQTCDLLGSAEMSREHLDAAEAWFLRSREMAEELKDQRQLAVIFQNLGILYQTKAEHKEDEKSQNQWLQKAAVSVQESLSIELNMQNQVGAAASYFQLGILYTKLEQLEQAEENAKKGLEIQESLNLPDVYKTYDSLANICRAKGDETTAQQWEAKRDTKLDELNRLRRGDGADAQERSVPQELLQAIALIAQSAHDANKSNSPFPPEIAEVLAQLKEAPSPFNELADFFSAVAKNENLPPVPDNLPDEIEEIVQSLTKAL